MKRGIRCATGITLEETRSKFATHPPEKEERGGEENPAPPVPPAVVACSKAAACPTHLLLVDIELDHATPENTQRHILRCRVPVV